MNITGLMFLMIGDARLILMGMCCCTVWWIRFVGPGASWYWQIFPDNDSKLHGAASSVFVSEAVRLLHEAGYEIGNLDATLILHRPKISPHKETIRANLAKLLGSDLSVVNLKTKNHEKVDSLGENRSIATHTIILLMRK